MAGPVTKESMETFVIGARVPPEGSGHLSGAKNAAFARRCRLRYRRKIGGPAQCLPSARHRHAELAGRAESRLSLTMLGYNVSR
jgi:hypothetical protein